MNGRATPEANHNIIAVLMLTILLATLPLTPTKPTLLRVPYPEACNKWSLMVFPRTKPLQLDLRPLILRMGIMEGQVTR